MPAEPTVQVLLATMNGERFLRAQIDSILRQTYPAIEILARDDGSRDGTSAILAEYSDRFPGRFRVIAGLPSGSAKCNFHHLMKACSAPYAAFADQDDVWVPGKIELQMNAMRALEKGRESARPMLIFSDLEVVAEDLSPQARSLWELHRLRAENVHIFRRLIMQNVVTGCTVLVNRPLVNLVTEMPADAAMHDWWIALVACAFGDASFLPEKLVQYRQHGTNFYGARRPTSALQIPRWRDHSQRALQWAQLSAQARAFLAIFGSTLKPHLRTALNELIAIEKSDSGLSRSWSLLRGGFFLTPLRANLATLWYLLTRGG